MNERREQGVRTRDRTSGTRTKVIAGERGEEISQVVDFAAGQNFGELHPSGSMRLMGPCEAQPRPGTRAVRLGTVNNFLATQCHSLIHP